MTPHMRARILFHNPRLALLAKDNRKEQRGAHGCEEGPIPTPQATTPEREDHPATHRHARDLGPPQAFLRSSPTGPGACGHKACSRAPAATPQSRITSRWFISIIRSSYGTDPYGSFFFTSSADAHLSGDCEMLCWTPSKARVRPDQRQTKEKTDVDEDAPRHSRHRRLFQPRTWLGPQPRQLATRIPLVSRVPLARDRREPRGGPAPRGPQWDFITFG